MARSAPSSRARLPRLWAFALEHLLLLPLGAAIALIWANAATESYYRVVYALAFAVNDVAMVFFFAVITKEVVEATAPDGVLHPWRRALLPLIAAVGATSASALLHIPIVNALDEPALGVVWPVAFGTDIAFCYFIARIVFGRHPVLPFVILLAIGADALGFLAIAIFQPVPNLHLVQGAVLMAAALAVAAVLRGARVRSFWPYLLLAGSLSWYALLRGGLHPALAMVPIMPFLPHGARDPGFFVDAEPGAKDTLSRFEIVWRYPAQIALFLFGLVNAGFEFHALELGTIGLPIAMIVGRPVGVLAGAGLAVALGFRLPNRVGFRELLVIGIVVAVGFSVALFFSTALLPPGQLRSETSMGVLLSLGAAPLALASAKVLRIGRFARS